jgi:hypothetical protein
MTKEELYKWMKEQGLIKTYEMEDVEKSEECLLKEITEIKPDPQVKKDYDQWKNNLPSEERKQFEFAFEEDDGLIKNPLDKF